jgi:hypothetical protein
MQKSCSNDGQQHANKPDRHISLPSFFNKRQFHAGEVAVLHTKGAFGKAYDWPKSPDTVLNPDKRNPARK